MRNHIKEYLKVRKLSLELNNIDVGEILWVMEEVYRGGCNILIHSFGSYDKKM